MNYLTQSSEPLSKFTAGSAQDSSRLPIANACYELRKRAFDVVEEQPVPLIYDDLHMECGFRADLIVNHAIVVELKAKSAIHPIDEAQTLSHLRLLKLRLGLLINFHEERLVDGVRRVINGWE